MRVAGDRLYGSTKLTAREREIVPLIAEGIGNKEAAVRLGMTEGVLKNALRSIYDKLGVWSNLELALWYTEHRGDV